jgi:probable addiction module antidote protein
MKREENQTGPWDVRGRAVAASDMTSSLEKVLRSGDLAKISAMLGEIARAQGMTNIARKTGLRRESLYKSLSADGNPEFATVMKVVQALGLQLHVEEH